MNRRAAFAFLVALATAALLVAGALRLARPRHDDGLSARLSVAGALRGGGEGFARALAPRAFSFPADHGPHPAFRTEWWYWTGNLATAEGRRFGFQLTFFRNAVAPRSPASPARASAWAARDVYLAHFTLTDVAGRRFHSFERVRRGALGLAGARALPFRVWLDDWQAAGPAAGDAVTPMRLTAAAGEGDAAGAMGAIGIVGIDLALDRGKPPVLQGDRGLSRKGAGLGQASYYYSLTRMPARGRVRTGEGDFAVSGLAWMDREWSTSSLGPDQVGWDWFSLQLDDHRERRERQDPQERRVEPRDPGDGSGRELMFYRLRLAGGGSDPASRGVLVEPDGTARPLTLADVRIDVLDRWVSPWSGARYPSLWRLRVPAAGLDLTVRPRLADQELDTSFRYWEGAVEVSGRAAGRSVRGSGYVELTGYAERPEAGESR